MSRKYKIVDQDNLYFVSFAVVHWIDVFIREEYKTILLESIRYCQKNKGLEVYAWCLMPSYVHMIIGTHQNAMEGILRDLKSYSSKKLRAAISANLYESRREWMIWMMERAARKNGNNKGWQFWQQNNHPIELAKPKIMEQKLDYIHNNPVEAGFVKNPEDWTYSSAADYSGVPGLLEIMFIE